MNLTDILIVGSFAFIVVLLWIIIGATQLKARWQKVQNQWQIVDQCLRERQDSVPLLIELFRKAESNEKLVKTLIEERMRAAKEYGASAKKIEYEHDLSMRINELVAIADKNELLAKNTKFLDVKGKINGLESLMESESKNYNEMVRAYNKNVKSFFLVAIAKVFGYKKANIFEVEI